MIRRVVGRVLRKFVKPEWPGSPVSARHALPSWLYSADDESSRPSERLLETAVRCIDLARSIDLGDVSGRIEPPHVRYPDVWPGEHYKLLAAMVGLLAPRLVIEIGTAEGLSALTMKKYLRSDSRLLTFDVIPWREYPGCVLTGEDFADGRLEQRICDLADPEVFRQHSHVLAAADLLFVDAPKDGRFEPAFLKNLDGLSLSAPLMVVLDDIRVWNMLSTWREITKPKLDLTSFGHWSGTGLIDWRMQ